MAAQPLQGTRVWLEVLKLLSAPACLLHLEERYPGAGGLTAPPFPAATSAMIFSLKFTLALALLSGLPLL